MWRKNGPLQLTCLRVRLAKVQLIGGGGAVVQWQAGRSVCSHRFHIWASDCLRHQTFAIYGHQVFWDKNQRHYMDLGFPEIWSETQSPKLSPNFVFLNYRTCYPTDMDGWKFSKAMVGGEWVIFRLHFTTKWKCKFFALFCDWRPKFS